MPADRPSGGGPPSQPTPFTGTELATGGDHDTVSFEGLDLSGQVADSTTFLDCVFGRCRADGLRARRSRFVDTAVAEVQARSIDLAESTWRDSIISGGRLGALLLPGAQLMRVRIRGVKVDFANLRGVTLRDVVFEDCVLGDVSCGTAAMTDVSFVGSRIGELDVNGATLCNVDLSGASLDRLDGLDHLRGAIVSAAQLLDLAPLLAAHLGLGVVEQPAS